MTEVGEGEGEVNLVAWAGYVEDGSTDPDVDWVTRLREGDRLPGQRQDRQHLRRDGAADANRPVRRASRPRATRPARLFEGGDVDPINTDLIPNYADVYEGLKDQDYNTFDGQPYGVPHGRGANLLMWNTDEVTARRRRRGTSSSTTRAEQSGKVTAYDNPIYIADAALYLREHKPGARDRGSVRARPGAVRRRDRPAEGAEASTSASTGRTTAKEIQAFENGDTTSARPGSTRPTCSSRRSPVEIDAPRGGVDRLVGHLDDQLRG